MCLKIQECLKAISKQNGDRICEDRGWLGKASCWGGPLASLERKRQVVERVRRHSRWEYKHRQRQGDKTLYAGLRSYYGELDPERRPIMPSWKVWWWKQVRSGTMTVSWTGVTGDKSAPLGYPGKLCSCSLGVSPIRNYGRIISVITRNIQSARWWCRISSFKSKFLPIC